MKLFDWDKEIKNTTGNGKATPRIPVKAGLHTVGVTFLATNDLPGTELNRPFQRTMNTPGAIPGFLFYPHVGQVTIEGPLRRQGRDRHGEPPQDLRLPPDDARARKTRARARSSRRSPSTRSAGRRPPRT